MNKMQKNIDRDRDYTILGFQPMQYEEKMSSKICSVIIPAYNCERTISYTLNSVLNQTYPYLEVIVVDDCSDDKTAEIINTYAKADSRVKYLRNSKNSGVAQTRNNGIKNASGDYIAFIDSDDIWNSDKLEKQLLYHDGACKFTFTGYDLINENGEKLGVEFKVPKTVNEKELLKKNIIALSSVIIDKSIVTEDLMKKEYSHEDYAAWLELLKTNKCAYGVNETLMHYRMTPNTRSFNRFDGAKKVYQIYKCYCKFGIVKRYYYMTIYLLKSLSKYKRFCLYFFKRV